MMIGGERELVQRGSIVVEEQELPMFNVLFIVIICLNLYLV